MGWEMSTARPNKPQMYDYENGSYTKAEPSYYSWMLGTKLSRVEPAIKFINDTGNPLKIGRIAVKTVACDSGGHGYWPYGYYESTPCKGYGARYTCYVRVSNDNGNTYQESEQNGNIIPDIDGPNYDTLGTRDGGKTSGYSAGFGMSESLPDNRKLKFHSYDIENCPIIEPNGICYVHLRIRDFNIPAGGNLRQVNIKFILNPLEMEVEFEPEESNYIWVFGEDRKWHLTKPLQLMAGNGWIDVDDQ